VPLAEHEDAMRSLRETKDMMIKGDLF
jgi:hypothetical protein